MGEGEGLMPLSSGCPWCRNVSDEAVELADVPKNGESSYTLFLRPLGNGMFTGDVEGECSVLIDMAFKTLSFRRLVVPPSFLARERA